MQVNKTHNFFFHPLHENHSLKTKIASTITVVALSILTGFIFLAVFAAVNLRDRRLSFIKNQNPKEQNQNPDFFRDQILDINKIKIFDIKKPQNNDDNFNDIAVDEAIDLTKPTETILKSKFGFERSRQEPGQRFPYGYIGTVQGHVKFRERVAHVTQHDFHALSPRALRENREINPQVSLTLTAKRLAHSLSLNGEISLEKSEANLEGFSEVFTLPMVADSWEQFTKEKPDIVNADMAQWVLDGLTKFTRNDGLSEKEIEEHLKNVNSPNFEGPFCVSTGFDWHGTSLIFYRDFVFYMNRGGDPFNLEVEGEHISELSGPGTSIFKTNKPSFNLSKDLATKVFKRMSVTDPMTSNMKKIQSDLDLQFIDRKVSKGQTVGNCTYVNTKLAIKTLVALYTLKDKEKITPPDLDQAFETANAIYKKWVSFDRNYVVKDLVTEMKALEAADQKTSLTYKVLLNLLKRVDIKMKKLDQKLILEREKLKNSDQEPFDAKKYEEREKLKKLDQQVALDVQQILAYDLL